MTEKMCHNCGTMTNEGQPCVIDNEHFWCFVCLEDVENIRAEDD